jgi:transposase
LQAAQRNQRRLVSEVTARESTAELLKLLCSHMRRLEAEIAALLGSGPRGRNWTQALCSIKGVADRTVARVMAEMPEIGTLSNQAVSKLADLAPLADDSGKREGKGVVRGGRRQVRAILFVVASVVRRHDSNFAAFHQRLSAAGKPLKSNSHCSGAINFWCD